MWLHCGEPIALQWTLYNNTLEYVKITPLTLQITHSVLRWGQLSFISFIDAVFPSGGSGLEGAGQRPRGAAAPPSGLGGPGERLPDGGQPAGHLPADRTRMALHRHPPGPELQGTGAHRPQAQVCLLVRSSSGLHPAQIVHPNTDGPLGLFKTTFKEQVGVRPLCAAYRCATDVVDRTLTLSALTLPISTKAGLLKWGSFGVLQGVLRKFLIFAI